MAMTRSARSLPPVSPLTGIVRALNDTLRRYGIGGRISLSPGITALSSEDRDVVGWAVSKFGAFDADLDPEREHAYGAFQCRDHHVVFLIDNGSTQFASDSGCHAERMLRVMLDIEHRPLSSTTDCGPWLCDREED
jgi:hypothetical protein